MVKLLLSKFFMVNFAHGALIFFLSLSFIVSLIDYLSFFDKVLILSFIVFSSALLLLNQRSVYFFRVDFFFLFLFVFSCFFSLILSSAYIEYFTTFAFWSLGVVVSFLVGASIRKWPKVIITPLLYSLWFLFFALTTFDLSLVDLLLNGNMGNHDELGVNVNRMATWCLIPMIGAVIGIAKYPNGKTFASKEMIVIFIGFLVVYIVGARAALAVAAILLILSLLLIILSSSSWFRLALQFFSILSLVLSFFLPFIFLGLVSNNVIYGSGRDSLWATVLNAWEDSPFFGLGYGGATGTLKSNEIDLSTHSAFLQILVDYGVIGYALFFVFVFSIFLANAQKKQPIYNSIIVIVFFLIAFHQNFSTLVFHLSSYSFLFFCFIGWAGKEVKGYKKARLLS